ncbi:MAG: endolytic transglycosylase MltG [Gemmatimonadetes bacterium]|nr:endolytic transglycosylase MltG [Gemmatimonadota bacterium]
MSRPRTALLAVAVFAACTDVQPGTETVRVTVPRGATVGSVTDSLAARGVILSPRRFRWYIKLAGYERSIQAGVYDFPRPSPVADAVRALVAGQAAQNRLVLPEGLMLKEIAEFVESQLHIPAESVLVAAHDTALARQVGAREPTLEGYLYPNTYHVRIGTTAREIVRQMVGEFEARWRPEWEQRLDTLGLTRDELVTLASIIEGEAHHEADRFYVSSVYHNRLRRGMRLQADPTVIYALGRRRRLFLRDYETPSRYNTYLIDGLPPHAVGQPSEASLEAALYPRVSDFLYFVAGPGGEHIFSRTYREHQAAIRRVRQGGSPGGR